ncbi:Concanavalin A-like lectin/glucanase domain-containing protein [Dioscorea alata]|uniref:Concanavalin A-like lectin/glucanase domain-containing protein n=1 Tax=Dioscorea alata TaxID=55571 RepID=A0ACB7WIP9_DIOAL|nr:Concanavalin A-like lectin/glucanase domain-containing protein [Dioscorea alata]
MAGFSVLHALLVVDVVATLAMARFLPMNVISEPPSSTPFMMRDSSPVAGEPVAPQAGMDRPDKSIAGAEVILGGFATVFLAVIFAYIRVTRKTSKSRT